MFILKFKALVCQCQAKGTRHEDNSIHAPYTPADPHGWRQLQDETSSRCS